MRLLKKVPIHPTFYLIFLWFLISGQGLVFCVLLLSLLFHELGHYLVAKKLKYKLSSFYLAPYGVALNYKEGKFLSSDEVKIALAGPCANFITSIFVIALWWIFPAVFSFTHSFVEVSLTLGLFNLLPAYPLDGGRVVVGLLGERISRKKALNLTIWLNVCFCIMFAVAFVISCFVNYNPFLALMVVFLLGGILETKMEGKYETINLFDKKIKNFSNVKMLAIMEDVTLAEMIKAIDSAKLTVFFVVSKNGKTKMLTEKKVLSLCMTHPITTKIKDIDFFN